MSAIFLEGLYLTRWLVVAYAAPPEWSLVLAWLPLSSSLVGKADYRSFLRSAQCPLLSLYVPDYPGFGTEMYF